MTDLEKIINDILREVYSEAEPPLDFDEVLDNPEEMDKDWYQNHYLDPEREREIVVKHIDKHNLTKREKMQVTMTAILNYGPASPPENENE